jgi:hypothetical protein
MYYKIVNRFDVECLLQSINHEKVMEEVTAGCREKVMDVIQQTISIFDEYYGEKRHPERDLGGYLLYLPTLQDTKLFYDKILKHYNLDVVYAEIDEEIAVSDNIKFRQQTFLLSSDYGLVIVFPKQ